MAKLLYVTCNLKPVEHSRSLSVGKEFLDEYLRSNPGDEVHFLELYRDNIQRIDADVLGGWGITWVQTFQSGMPFSVSYSGSPNRYLPGGSRPNTLTSVENDFSEVPEPSTLLLLGSGLAGLGGLAWWRRKS